ncbi:hypothetical protein J7L06_02545 [Candidatus Bathyarchaeota archaeon]|nr:hypothetical protein [Candidatus Bathyarchaeota archaeon]
MPGRTLLPVAVALLVFIVGALALNPRMIEVNVTGPSPPVANKLKIDVIPEDVIVNEEVKIIIKDPEGSPIEEAKVYVAKNHPSTKGVYIGKTNSSGELTYVFEEEGWYKVYVEKEGFLPQETLVNVKLEGILSFSIELKEAHNNEQLKTIHITSNGYPVEKAKIYINGMFVGYTNSNGELSYTFKLGKVYEITVKKEGYRGLLIILDMDPEGGTGSIIRPLKDT